jgi:hypothetical protein
MFRTARGFLLIAPPAFVAALVAFLLVHGRAAEAFVPYPFLSEALGHALSRRPIGRFAVASWLFFVIPYLVAALLLLLADLGVGAASGLWRKKGAPAGKVPAVRAPVEARVALAAGAVLLSAFAGARLDRVAHGGELPGGVNVAPLLVAAIPFLAVGTALVLASAAALPRAVAGLFSGRGRTAGSRSVGPREVR